MFAFVTFQFSGGRTAECAAAHGTTWWNHSFYTGIWPSALQCLQQLQAGASSTSSVQPLASKQESNGTASSSSVSSPQLPHSAISSQVPAGPTRNVTGDVSTSLAKAATQLSFLEFLAALQPLNCSSSAPAAQPHPTSRCCCADVSTQRCFC